jgi:putative membrane-bound dehydrogenase-like protein
VRSATVDDGTGFAHHAAMIESLCLVLVLALQSGEESFPSHDPAADLVVAEGLEITLAAESPLLFNPTAMDVDHRGRLWVTEAVNYRKWNGRNPGRDHELGDRVVVLNDDDGDGIYDRSTVFAQEPRLVAPLGIAVFGNQVVVSCSPDLIVYTDDDGDDVADRSEVLLTGFGGNDHDHGLHSVVAGPDGRWYFAAGNAGPHIVTDRSGWTLRSGSLYTGGGRVPADNKPGLVSDDGRVWVGGLILSVNPDGTDLRVHAHNFRNQYEVALDAFGEMFTEDNDDDGNRGCRTTWVMEGGNYGYFSEDGSRYWSADRRPGQDTPTAHWHQDDPGVMPAGTINGAGGPTGVAVYEGALMAEWIDGAVLNADAGAGRVYAHRPRAEGAGIVLDPGVLIRARDDEDGRGAKWFRPSDVVVATDGSVLVADWYDPGVGGHMARDGQAYGRVLRIAPKGHQVAVPEIDVSTPEGAASALISPAVNVRQLGRLALQRAHDRPSPSWGGRGQPDQACDVAEALLTDDDPRVRALALGAEWRGHSERSQDGQQDRDERVRVTAMRSAHEAFLDGHGAPWPHRSFFQHDPGARGDVWAQLGETFDLSDPTVLRELAIGLAEPETRPYDGPPVAASASTVPLHLAPVEAARLDLWVELALAADPEDRVLMEALGLAAREREQACFLALASRIGEAPARWSPTLSRFAWRLHPPAARPGLAVRAGLASLPLAERRRMIDALAFCTEREAAEAMVTLALTGPEDTQDLARFWVEHREGNLWAEHGLGVPTLGGALEETVLAWSSGEGLVHDEILDVDVDVSGAQSLWVVIGDGGNGNSCDWAALLEPVAHTPDGPVRLTQRRPVRAEAGWGDVRMGEDCVGGELTVGGDAVADGIGTHAPSLLAWELPEGAMRFTARFAAEDTGLSQGDPSPTSIAFEVRLHSPPDLSALRALEELVRDTRADPEDREDAAVALAEHELGGMVIVDLARQGLLDDELAAAVGDVIWAHPDAAVRALAHGLVPRPGQLRPLPPLEDLLTLSGDPSRGREIFGSNRAQCSTCHRVRGRGADVGPDLTEVATKLDREALLDAILNPSAGIAHGYDGWMLTTADGRRLTGFVLAEGDTVLFKDSQAERHVFSADDIVDRHALTLSIMPEGVALGLEPSELADLMAFLTEERASAEELRQRMGALRAGRPERAGGDAALDGGSGGEAPWRDDPAAIPVAPGTHDRLGEAVVLFDGTSLDAWEAYLPGGEDPTDTWSIVDGELICEGMPIGYLKTREPWQDFVLELEWRFLPGRPVGNSGVLLRLNGPDEVWPRSFEAQLHHRNAGDIWNIGAMGAAVDGSRTNGRRTLKLLPSNEKPHGEWNRYRITLHRDRLTLEVNGEVQNTATWCEELLGPIALQSEGAPIAFRDVVLTPILRGS